MTDTIAAQPIEEQTLPRYSQKRYYPVRIGQRLVERYSIVSKLGFGAYSTVWLAWDERSVDLWDLIKRGKAEGRDRNNEYVSVKVFVQDDSTASPVLNEIRILQHLKQCPRDHTGAMIARLPDDHFQLDGPTGQSHCIVSKPQGCSLGALQKMFPNGRLPIQLAPHPVRCLLACINWLVLDCDLIHTGQRWRD